jgi:hypothetical protein
MGAYLSNYGYRAYRAYRAAPTGRQSDASISQRAPLSHSGHLIRRNKRQTHIRLVFSQHLRALTVATMSHESIRTDFTPFSRLGASWAHIPRVCTSLNVYMYVDQTQFLAIREPKRIFGTPDIVQITTLPCGCYVPIIGLRAITVGLRLTDTHMYMYTCTHQTQQSAQLPPLEEPDREPRRDVHPVDSLRPAVLYDKSIIHDRSKLDHIIARTALIPQETTW